MRTRTVERSILHHVNIERKKRNLPSLFGNPALITAARDHSQWMARTGRFSHTGAGGNSHLDRTSKAGYIGGTSENIWQTSTKGGKGRAWKSRFRWSNDRELGKAAVITWMNSPGHRENMLSTEWQHIGIGVAENKRGQAYLTQCFGSGLGLPTIVVDPLRMARPLQRFPRTLKRLLRHLILKKWLGIDQRMPRKHPTQRYGRRPGQRTLLCAGFRDTRKASAGRANG